jgi:hypothetical protein
MDMDMEPYCVNEMVLTEVTKETGRDYTYGLNVNDAWQECQGEKHERRQKCR